MDEFEYEYEQPESSFEWTPSQETQESAENELANELLEVSSEEEFEQFLGNLVSRVARGASSFMKSGVGQAVGGVLRNVAKSALPMVGSALGSFVAPGLGTAIGGQLGSMAAKLLEAEELESMGEAEAEYESARRYVRWASGTVRSAMRAPRGAPARAVARSAAVSSARRYAPTLVRPVSRRRTSSWRSRRGPAWGTWDGGPYRARRRCTCGSRTVWDTDDGSGDRDDTRAPDPGSSDPDENEGSTTGGTHGRWHRSRRGIVVAGV